jgi:hypothetical protein
MQQNHQLSLDSVNFTAANPLDFLLSDNFMTKRKTRSSMESIDRDNEIPQC